MKKNLELLLYPIIVLVIALSLGFAKIHGSSVAIFNNVLSRDISEDKNLLFGKPRLIRGDQFVVMLPIIISQDINNEPQINMDMGEGTNLGTQIVPSKNFLSIFRPTLLPFYMSNNSEVSYSLYWWLEFALLLIGTYLLLLSLTKNNIFISIFGSLLFLFTPFLQWWNQSNTITWMSFGIFFFIKILKEKTLWKALLYGLGFTYSMMAFITILYPPFQIAIFYITIPIALGLIISHKKEILENKKISIPVILLSFIITGILVSFCFLDIKDVVNAMLHTSYPGQRFVQAGMGNINYLLNGFYNFFLQIDSNTPPFANQSESSNFFLLFPIIIWVIYKNIQQYKNKKKLDYISLGISLTIILLLIWYFFKLPDFISKYTFLYMIPPQRLFISFGFGLYILYARTLAMDMYKWRRNLHDNIVAILLILAFSVLVMIVGFNILKEVPGFLQYPSIMPPYMKIILISLFSLIILLFLFKGWKKMFYVTMVSFGILSTIYINPLYRGLDIITNTDLAREIRDLSEKDDSKWAIYGHYYLSQYALANNANVLNGVQMYPQFKTWKILDPDEKFFTIYNRYGHFNLSEYQESEDLIEQTSNDAYIVNISPCSIKMQELGVKYVLTSVPLEDTACFREVHRYNNITIYERLTEEH